MSLIVYQTDLDGYFIGPVEADPDPLNPGGHLIPAGCIGSVPPPLAANEAARWVSGAWAKEPDFVGMVYWLADGSQHEITQRGIAPPADALSSAPPPPPPTQAEIIAFLTAAVQKHLDTTAKTRNYDGILSLCSYATSANPRFGPEGLAGVAWRDAVWASCYTILAEVQGGQRTVPTADQLLAELPAMVWPA